MSTGSDGERNGSTTIERMLRWAKLILSVVGIVGGWALALTVWLVSMHSDVERLKADHEDLHKRYDQLDTTGTRALETLRNRQTDVIATNAAQDARMREMEAKLADVTGKQVENRYLLEQAIDALRRNGMFGISPRERFNQPPTNNGKP